MQRLMKWLANKISPAKEPPPRPLRHSGPRVRPKPAKPKPRPTEPADLEYSGELGGRIEDAGPGKNVLVRNKYVREETGTHETLKIIDDSLVVEEDEGGMDPYNTGRFDRSKSWDSSRSRK
jgi:hypothetical protein